MLNYVESENFLSNRNKKFIDNIILKSNFPYVYRTQCVPGDGNSFLVHNVLERPEKRTSKELYQSKYFEELGQILISFCRKNNIPLKEMLRVAVNLTFNNGSKQSPIHIDHNYPHKQLIVYFNDCKDKNAYTVILNEKNKVFKKIKPKQYKGICIDALPHYAIFPKKGERIIGVFTFR
jgi:hypothetical protein